MRVLSLGVDTVPSDIREWTSTTAYHHRILARKLETINYVIFSDAVDKYYFFSEKNLFIALIPKGYSKSASLFPFLYYALKIGRSSNIDLIISQDIQIPVIKPVVQDLPLFL